METVYIETTIPSYIISEQSQDIILLSRQVLTKEWWDNERKYYDLFISQIVIDEILAGNKVFAKKRLNLINRIKLLDFNTEIEELAKLYMQYFNFPEKLVRDIYHIAYSVYYNMDFLLTWNCRHLANAHFKVQIERFNSKFGLKTPEICTPEELKNL